MSDWSQILQRKRLADEDVIQGLAVIARNARVQTQLIEDLLDISRIVSGQLQMDVQRVELAGVIDVAVQSVVPAAEAKGNPAPEGRRPDGRYGHRRPEPPPTGRVEPVEQRGEIHAARRARAGVPRTRALARRGWSSPTRARGALAGVPAAPVRAVPTGRRLLDAPPAGWRSCGTWSSCTAGASRAFSTGPGQGSTFTVALPLRAAQVDEGTPRV